MKTELKKENILTSSAQIAEAYFDVFKEESDFKIGLEIEQISLDKNTFLAKKYNGHKGVCNFMKVLSSKYGWEPILDENSSLIGILKQDVKLTLEPGAQIELSLPPKKTILEIKNTFDLFMNELNMLADKFDLLIMPYAIQPFSDFKNISVIPKERYGIMTKYFEDKGKLAYSMMRETAGIQVNIDYSSEEDAIDKLKTCFRLSPFITAMFANSPIRKGKITKYKSNRALAWLQCDDNRCGIFLNNIETFADYISILSNIKMIYIRRNNKNILINGEITFGDFIKKGYKEFSPTMEDFILHLSLFFPDVRLKKECIEIRNQDVQEGSLKYAIPALYKGLLYNKKAYNDVKKLLDNFNVFDIQKLRYQVPETAVNTVIRNSKVSEINKEIFKIAKDGLKQFNEEIYLYPLEEYVNNGITPADKMIKEYYLQTKK